MSKTKSKKKTSKADEANALAAAEAKKNELVQFVANNIINTLTLSQTVTLIQQVSLRDANTIVSEADEEKLAEIEEQIKPPTYLLQNKEFPFFDTTHSNETHNTISLIKREMVGLLDGVQGTDTLVNIVCKLFSNDIKSQTAKTWLSMNS